MKRLYPWHRYLGLLVASLALLLSVTGIFLNHSVDLNLDKRYVHWNWLLDWYNLPAPKIESSFVLDAQTRVSQIQGQLYLNQQHVLQTDALLQGAVLQEESLLLLLSGQLYLFTAEGELIEKISEQQGLPAEAKRLGLLPNNELILETNQGHYQADADLLGWLPTNTTVVRWSSTKFAPESFEQALSQQARYRLLHWERVLLDLHNGHIFGKIGVYLVDLAGVLLMILAISGFMMWSGRRRLQKQRQKGFTLLEVLIALVIVALTLTSLMKVSSGSKRLAIRSLEHIQNNAYLRAVAGAAQSQYKPEMPDYPKTVQHKQAIKLENIQLLKKASRQTQPMTIALESYQLKNKQGVVVLESMRWVQLDKPK